MDLEKEYNKETGLVSYDKINCEYNTRYVEWLEEKIEKLRLNHSPIQLENLKVNWLPFVKPNFNLFIELCNKKKCLCLYNDGTKIPFHHKNHPLAIMTHFTKI